MTWAHRRRGLGVLELLGAWNLARPSLVWPLLASGPGPACLAPGPSPCPPLLGSCRYLLCLGNPNPATHCLILLPQRQGNIPCTVWRPKMESHKATNMTFKKLQQLAGRGGSCL